MPVQVSMHPFVWGLSDDDVFICGTQYDKASGYRTDGTAAGTTHFDIPDEQVFSIGGVSSTELWFGGSGLHHYDGHDWTSYKKSVYEPRYVALAPVSANEAFALTERGEVFQRAAHGEWTNIAHPVWKKDIDTVVMKATNADDIWIVAKSRNDLKSTWTHWNGIEWTSGDFGADQEYGKPLSLWSDASGDLFVLFDYGGVYRWDALQSKFEWVTSSESKTGCTRWTATISRPCEWARTTAESSSGTTPPRRSMLNSAKASTTRRASRRCRPMTSSLS